MVHLAVGAVFDTACCGAVQRGDAGAAVWAVNATHDHVDGELLLTAWTLAGEQHATQRRTVTLAAHRATELGDFCVDARESLVLAGRLQIDGEVVSRATLWSQPFKYLTLPDPDLDVEQESETLRLRVNRPAKGVWLSADADVSWSDNMLDVLPDDEQIVVARDLGNRPVYARWLGAGLRTRVC